MIKSLGVATINKLQKMVLLLVDAQIELQMADSLLMEQNIPLRKMMAKILFMVAAEAGKAHLQMQHGQKLDKLHPLLHIQFLQQMAKKDILVKWI